MVDEQQSFKNTLILHAKNRMRNFLVNRPEWAQTQPLATVSELFKGRPALVCGAGPFLEDVRPYVRDFKRSGIVLAADTALEAFHAWGLGGPHIAAALDPQPLNQQKFKRLRGTDPTSGRGARLIARTALVALPCTDPATLRMPWLARFIWHGEVCVYGRWMQRFWERHGPVGRPALNLDWAMPAAIHLAYCTAALMGCAPIYLAGVDLCYRPGRPSHVHESSRRREVDLHDREVHEAEGYGGPVRTLDAFEVQATHLGAAIRRFGVATSVIGGGLLIPGAPPVDASVLASAVSHSALPPAAEGGLEEDDVTGRLWALARGLRLEDVRGWDEVLGALQRPLPFIDTARIRALLRSAAMEELVAELEDARSYLLELPMREVDPLDIAVVKGSGI